MKSIHDQPQRIWPMVDKHLVDEQLAELEARFREIEADAEIERLQRRSGTQAPKPNDDTEADSPEGAVPDPLADLKAAVDVDEPARYLLVDCPHCTARNRISLQRIRRADPLCGACRNGLWHQRPT